MPDLEVVDRVSHKIFPHKRVIDLEIQGFCGAGHPTHRAGPPTPYKMIWNGQGATLDAKSNPRPQHDSDQSDTEKKCLDYLYET